MSSESSEWRAILRRWAENEKNWRSAMAQLPALIDSLDAKGSELTKRAKDLEGLEGRRADLRGQITTLEQRHRELTQQVGALNEELTDARHAGRLKSLVASLELQEQHLTEAIAAKQAALDTLTTDLAALKKAHNLG